MLNELDKELGKGTQVCPIRRRLHDSVQKPKSAERTLENIVPYIEGRLFLKVNRTKTTVSHISKIKYLGYAFYRHQKKVQIPGTSQVSQKMKG